MQGGSLLRCEFLEYKYIFDAKNTDTRMELWSLNVRTPDVGWQDVTNVTRGRELANRTFAGAAASVPGLRSNIEEYMFCPCRLFIWTKIETALATQNLIRSHICRAVGGQLLIIGGYPPGQVIPRDAPCDSELAKSLAIGSDGLSRAAAYSNSSTYRTPNMISDIAGNRTASIEGGCRID